MNWKNSKKEIIGAILIITVIGGGTLYNYDIARLLANPDQDIFVVHQPDKNKVNVIQRIKGTTFNRYEVSKDQICQFLGSKKIACYSWIVHYEKGDTWAKMTRQTSKVTMEVDELAQRVFVRKTTPYSKGIMEETLTILQKDTEFTVSFKPTDSTANQLVMKVSNLKGKTIPFDFGDQTTIRFDDVNNFVFHWDGAADSFSHHWFDGKNLWLYFKAKAGEINLGI